ncbi:MAG: Glycerophosphodiester phosphodiesterase [Thermoleophilia bacterium]|nr:Glycerophosphodiester phosphodiesterase [Thermoleophilia bacterium]
MTLVIAHRGASWELPENTLPAFERAIELGADYVEFDLHAARDGSLVVCHDPPRGGEPRLEEAIELLHGRTGIMCELKSPWRYRRHDVVRRTVRLLPEDAVVVSFDARALAAVMGRRVLQHVGYGASIRSAADYAWGVGFHDRRVTQRGLAKARALSLATTVYTVNDPARMRELAALGVDGIFSDRPDLLRATLNSLRG